MDMSRQAAEGLAGLRVVALSSRRAEEMARLIRNQGGEPRVVAALAEVPLADNEPAIAFAEALLAGEVDVVILLTGSGTRVLAQAIETRYPREEWLSALGRTVVVARSGKPAAVLRELGGPAPARVAREPYTWREVLQALDGLDVAGKRVAVQEYGETNPELLAGLTALGARVLRVPVYAWTLPADVEPLRDAVRDLAAGKADAVLFTSPKQVAHVLAVAADLGVEAELRRALGTMAVAAVGPSTRRALEEHGVPVDVEPEHPRMGHLVHALAQRARDILAAKRRGGDP